MEIVTALLSSLLLLISPVGFVVDQVAEDAIRSQLAGAESLEVRVDGGPSYQLLQGRVDRIRIAGRGISPVPGLRLAVAELETDPVDLEFKALRNGQLVLDEPFQGAVHLVLTEADVNAFLRSPFVQNQLESLTVGGLAPAQARERDRYKIVNPTIDFLAGNRFRISVELEDLVQEDRLLIEVETGLDAAGGDQLVLVAPTLTVNEELIDEQIVNLLLGDIGTRLNLQQLERSGLTARVLNLTTVEDTAQDALDLALWVRVDPSAIAPPTAAEPIEPSETELVE
ncbi:MAG: DUF2993 domain-containing protein [Cyanobacteria bacterium J06581_3]